MLFHDTEDGTVRLVDVAHRDDFTVAGPGDSGGFPAETSLRDLSPGRFWAQDFERCRSL